MKKDYKMYGLAVAAIMFVLGIYFLGHAGANYLQSNSSVPSEDSGALFSMRSTALIQFFAGFIIAIVGTFIVFVFLKKRPEEESF